MQLVQDQLQVRGVHTGDGDVAARHRRRDTPRRGDDAVADHTVFGRVQLGHAVDRQRRGSRALDLGAHLVEHLAQVDDVRFARGVVDGRDTFCDHRRHQDVLGRADRRELELDLGPAQFVGGGDHATVFDVALRAELPQPRLMHVQGARADGVTAG